jgi:hypothetical protein
VPVRRLRGVNGLKASQLLVDASSGRIGMLRIRRLVLFANLCVLVVSLALAVWPSAAGAGVLARRSTRLSAPALDGWVIQPSPNPFGSSGATLRSVVCTNQRSCVAVGDYFSGGTTLSPLAEAWDGAGWSIQSTPVPDVAVSTSLSSVSCRVDQCMAVGYFMDTSFTNQPLAERWDGSSWSVVDVPVPAGSTGTRLGAVDCASDGACIAVGWYQDLARQIFALAARWDGSAWSLQIVPDPGQSTLSAVDCPGPTRCLAVGSTFTGQGYATLAERWNGHVWAVMPTPNPEGSLAYLQGVSCPSLNVCTAVGRSDYGSDEGTLAEQWRRGSWVIVSTPNPEGVSHVMLSGVACTRPGSCTAVGQYEIQAWYYGTLSEHLQHGVWTIQSMPDPPGGQGGQMFGIDCTTAACVAVGSFDSGFYGDIPETLVERHSV